MESSFKRNFIVFDFCLKTFFRKRNYSSGMYNGPFSGTLDPKFRYRLKSLYMGNFPYFFGFEVARVSFIGMEKMNRTFLITFYSLRTLFHIAFVPKIEWFSVNSPYVGLVSLVLIPR